MQIDRRTFMKTTIGVAAAAAIAPYARLLDLPLLMGTRAMAHDLTGTTFEFSVREALVENVDQSLTYHWAWQVGHDAPSVAGPTLILEPGVAVTVTVHNPLHEPHGWAISDRLGGFLPDSYTGPIPAGGLATVTFTPENPGTYVYFDPENAPVNRVMGLFGGVVVNPAAGVGATTPYSGGSLPVPANIQQLFDDLGTTAHFPGEAWDPNNWNLWLFGSIDPVKNNLVAALPPGQVIAPAAFVDGYTPRYFYINGRQGYFAAHDGAHGHAPGGDPHTNHIIDLVSLIGRPRLIRNINVGLSLHSPHIHANHGYPLFKSNADGLGTNVGLQENVVWIDTWTSRPMNHADVLYPYIMPPDIPADTFARLKAGTSQEGFPDNPMHQDHDGVFVPGFPMFYPMHCHLELSQTSGGGNYPQGMVTHLEFEGVVPGI